MLLSVLPGFQCLSNRKQIFNLVDKDIQKSSMRKQIQVRNKTFSQNNWIVLHDIIDSGVSGDLHCVFGTVKSVVYCSPSETPLSLPGRQDGVVASGGRIWLPGRQNRSWSRPTGYNPAGAFPVQSPLKRMAAAQAYSQALAQLPIISMGMGLVQENAPIDCYMC